MTPDALALIIESLRAGVLLPAALKAARVRADAFADALAADDDVRAQVTAAEREGLAHASAVVRAPPIPAGFFASGTGPKREVVATVAPDDPDAKWARVRSEADALAPGPFGRFLWIDEKCIEHGLTPTSPWWLYWLERFYASGKRWGVWMVGRGGSKSTTLERVASADSLLTYRVVPPGQRWEYPFVSVGPEDANRRIRGIEAIYTIAVGLDVKAAMSPRPHIDMKDANECDIRLASVAGTIGNLSGLNAIGLIIDEAAKLHDKGTNANPLSEIIASSASAFRSRPDIRAICCSSAWFRSGAHYELIEQGDTETNFVARIGAPFLGAALEGLEAVALWEERGDPAHMRAPDPAAAKAIREHAATLTAESPNVPTWVANPMYGATPSLAAIATRIEVQALPAKMLGNLPRHVVWLREIASVPIAADEDGGVDFTAQCHLSADMSERMMQRRGGAPADPNRGRAVQSHPLAPPGDARYAGPKQPPSRRPRRRVTL